MTKLQSIFTGDCIAVICQANFMQHGVHKVPRSISRKRPAGTVRPVRSRGKPYDQNSCLWVAKSRHRLGPVSLIQVSPAFSLANTFAVSSQPLAAFTGNDRFPNLVRPPVQNNKALGHYRLFTDHCHEDSSYRVWLVPNPPFSSIAFDPSRSTLVQWKVRRRSHLARFIRTPAYTRALWKAPH